MLESLHIKDLALVPTAQLDFSSGLTVLTGESGSGKSNVLDALALVTGSARPRIRARQGSTSGFVEAEFRLARDEGGRLTSQELQKVLDELGLLEVCSHVEERLVVARRVDASGRTRCFIQGQTVTRVALARVGSCLLELCGQSEAHNLRTGAAQLAALDRFARLGPLGREVERLVSKLRRLEAEEKSLEREYTEAEHRRDFVEFQLSELDACDFSGLTEKRARLEALERGSEQLEHHREVVDLLLGAERAILPDLKWLSTRLGRKVQTCHDEELSEMVAKVDAAADLLGEVALQSSTFASDSERDKEELGRLEGELGALKDLAQKHRVCVDDLPLRRQDLERQLAAAADASTRLGDLRRELAELHSLAQDKAAELHAARKKAATVLDKKMKKELVKVGLDGARFETHLSRGDLTTSGITHLDFGFSANPGHEPEPLSRVASGGELSRVLLCFRLATESAGAVLVFDEIDAGAGGHTAEKIAAALGRAGARSQVLCVTHWPQVAGVADHHFAVKKRREGDSVLTSVEAVEGEERLAEIGRMLGGTEKTARVHASELVKAGACAA